MGEDRKISLCIPTYNRVEMTFNAFERVLDDDRVSEIIIVDDASEIGCYNELKKICDFIPKVKLYRNLTNQDCYRNKATAIGYASNDFCILLDSDNIISVDYINRIFGIEKWEDDTCYMPVFAEPTFDYTAFEGMVISKENVAGLMDKPLFDTMLNCMNYFVNKWTYLEVFDKNVNPHTADSILQNYNWFAAGNKMKVVERLCYFHRIHKGSHYIQNCHLTGGLYEEIVEKLKALK